MDEEHTHTHTDPAPPAATNEKVEEEEGEEEEEYDDDDELGELGAGCGRGSYDVCDDDRIDHSKIEKCPVRVNAHSDPPSDLMERLDRYRSPVMHDVRVHFLQYCNDD